MNVRHGPRGTTQERFGVRSKGNAIRSVHAERTRGNLSRPGKRLRVTGNPEQLTNRQHGLQAASVERFADLNGLVSVRHLAANKQFKVKPDDYIFCASCVWDYRAESGYMRDIERQFQALAGEVLANRVVSLNGAQSETVTRFWALWRWRAELRNAPEPDKTIHGAGSSLGLRGLGPRNAPGSGDPLGCKSRHSVEMPP